MSDRPAETQVRKWIIQANLAGIDQVCADITGWLVREGLEEHLFPFRMLVHESLNNAVLHGCGLDSSRQVQCTVQISPDALLLEVDDGGPGFNWQVELEQEMVMEEKLHGRGLWIYHQYADRIEFNHSGNCVRFARLLEKKD